MAHISLYRKYRSQTFDEVIGQAHVTTTLANALSGDRLHHAYLFTGPRGTGKTSTARILAKAVNCVEGPTATPCNRCDQCTGITSGSSVDVIEIDAASHGGVDDVRDLRDRVAFAPVAARMKVHIVDECHMLSTAGWNAFLKTVEEPPGHVLFVFATTEPHKVLDTILSRTQRFDFKRIGAVELAQYCGALAEREGWQVEDGALDLVARAGEGSARDTLSILDQVVAFGGSDITVRGVVDVLGTVGGDVLTETVDRIAAGDVAGLCVQVGRLADGGQDLRQYARDVIEHLRRLFLVQTAPDAKLVDGTPEQLEALTAQAQRIGRVELVRAMDLMAEAMAQMRRGNTRLPLEIALVKAAQPEACGDPGALAARMDRLERRSGLDAAPAEVTPTAPTSPPPSAEPQPVAAAPTPDPAPTAEPTSTPDPTPTSEPTSTSERTPTPEPERAPEPEAQPAPVAAGGVDIDLVRSTWPALLDAVKTRSKRLHAFLSPAQPTTLSGGELALVFGPNSSFHAEQCASSEWREQLTAAFTDVLGEPLRVQCTVRDDSDAAPGHVGADAEEAAARSEATAVAESEAAEAAGELPDDDEAHERAVETLTRDLGATVVDDA
ncbi:MAG: DNA polymerase III subunit gamma/tau [Egibacteraceae bacterium]